MVSTARSRKLESEREALETAYLSALETALRDCSAGRLGLFGQNDELLPEQLRDRLKPPSVGHLEAVSAELREIRDRLGLPDFQPMAQLERLRQSFGPNALGEQRLAHRFLEELKSLR